MKRKKIYISTLIAFIIISVISYIYINQKQKLVITHQKCPEEYTEDNAGTAEYRNALADWTDSYFKTHSKATMSDWSKAKLQLWINNGCTIAIQRSKLSGKVSDLKSWEKVDYEMQTVLDKNIQ